jgi:hypothetical protein
MEGVLDENVGTKTIKIEILRALAQLAACPDSTSFNELLKAKAGPLNDLKLLNSFEGRRIKISVRRVLQLLVASFF